VIKVENFLNLEPLTLKDEDWFYRLTYPVGISDLSFPLLYAYRHHLNVKCMYSNEGVALIVQNDAYGKRCYTILGKINETVIKEFVNLGINEFSYVSGAHLPIFTDIEVMDWDISYDINFSDYVYVLDNFLDFGRKDREKYRYYKKHHFPRMVEMSQENWDDSYKISESWSEIHGDSSVFGDESEVYHETKKLIGHPHLEGMIIYDEDVPVSFAIIEKRGEMIVFPFSKNSVRDQGLTQFLYYEFFSQFKGRVKWINFEEDMGILGLRQFKQHFHPEFLIHKYTVRLRKN
jgi:hypothetical protein